MKTTGATFAAWLKSWPEGQYYDDSDETVNGRPMPSSFRWNPEDTIEWTCGWVYSEVGDELGEMDKMFAEWERSLTRTTVLCDVPKDRLPELAAFLKSIDGTQA